jgi:uncharacterized protein YdgA (DUF945 family)
LALLAPNGAVAELGDLALAADLRGWIGGLYAGTGRVTVGSAQVGPRESGTQIEGLNLSLAQTPRDERLDLRLELGADTLGVGGRSYRDARLGLTAEGLDGEALSELIQGLKALTSGAVSPAMRGLIGAALMARLLPQLAQAGPRISVDPLRVDTPEGPASARLSLGLAGSPPAGPQTDDPFATPNAWITALSGDGELELPEAIALEWLGRVGPEPVAGSGPAGQDPAHAARARLAPWVDSGWVSERDGRIASVFRLADGLLTVNGKTVPLLRGPAADRP